MVNTKIKKLLCPALITVLIFAALIIGLALLAGCYGNSNPKDTGDENAPLKNDQISIDKSNMNVKTFGAVGDGISDDSGAIKEAVKKAVSCKGDVYFPEGRYLVKKSVTIPLDCSAIFDKGAVIVTEGKRKLVSISGQIIAGNYQIFEGHGISKSIGNSQLTGNPVWFGAKGDGVTDDTEAFRFAWTIFNQLSVPYSEKGYVISKIETFKNMVLSGADPEKRTIIKGANSDIMFDVKAPGYITIENISFDAADMPEKSTVFYFDTREYMEYMYIINCDFTDAYYVFTDAKSTSLIMHMYFENLQFYRSRNSTFDIEDFEGFIFMKHILIDNSESYKVHKLDHGIIAIDIDDVRGTIFEDMKIIGGNSGYSDEAGFNIPGKVHLMASLWWDRVSVSDMGGYGIYLNNTILCSFIHVDIKNCGKGFRTDNSGICQLTDVNVVGAYNGDAISINRCYNSQIYDCHVSKASKIGIKLSGCQAVNVSQCTVSDCGKYGYNDMNGKKCTLNNSEIIGNKELQIKITSIKGSVSNTVYDEKGSVASGVGRRQW